MDFLFVQFHSTIKLFNKTENKIYQFSFIDTAQNTVAYYMRQEIDYAF